MQNRRNAAIHLIFEERCHIPWSSAQVMNTLAVSLNLPMPDRPRAPLNWTNVLIGIALSLLLHLLFVAWSLEHRISSPTVSVAKQLEVRLVHLLPLPVPEPAPPLPKDEKVTEKPGKTPKTRAEKTPQASITLPPAAAPAPITAPAAPSEEKHIDMNAIHASIKSAVADVDREKADTPNGQLIAKPLYPPEEETRMGKMINGTTRPDCKEQVTGMGLLAPLGVLATLLDKKDSGCKWR
jgi:hypothetical protein